MDIAHDVMAVFPLLVSFLAGGACATFLVAPRIYSHRGMFRLPVPQPVPHWKDQADLLDANVSVIPSGGMTVDRLRAAALEEAREVFGRDVLLHIEAVGKLRTMPSGKVSSFIVVRCLSPEGAAHDRA